MSWIVAGIATAGRILSNRKANEADKETATLEKYQSLIDVERLKGDVALESLNMRQDLATLEADQVAMSSAMGKSSTGAGITRMQEVGRSDMEDNISRMDDEVALSSQYGKVSRNAIDARTKANTTQRNIKSSTAGLMSLSKAFSNA